MNFRKRNKFIPNSSSLSKFLSAVVFERPYTLHYKRKLIPLLALISNITSFSAQHSDNYSHFKRMHFHFLIFCLMWLSRIEFTQSSFFLSFPTAIGLNGKSSRIIFLFFLGMMIFPHIDWMSSTGITLYCKSILKFHSLPLANMNTNYHKKYIFQRIK